jgi:hypothetical protein
MAAVVVVAVEPGKGREGREVGVVVVLPGPLGVLSKSPRSDTAKTNQVYTRVQSCTMIQVL